MAEFTSIFFVPGTVHINDLYRIRSIRHRGYYLFHRPSLCGVYSRAVTIREQCLLIPVAAREAIVREMVYWHHWSRRFWPLCWYRRILELVLDCLSCTCHRERVMRHVHVLRASWIVGVAMLLFERDDYFIHHYSRAVTNRERRLIERIRYLNYS